MIYKLKNTKAAEYIFAGWDETIIWSCLQGMMGHIYTDAEETPSSAMAFLGDFCFYAGQPREELVAYKPEWCSQDFIIMVPQNHQWGEIIEKYYGEKAKKVVRYAMKKELDIFDRNYLNHLVLQLPREYTISLLDEPIYNTCKKEMWCRDLVSQYADWPSYQKLGLGVVVIKDGQVVSGASSYSSYRGGIEIEIDTRKEYRRRGLALICGAKLILECLDRDWYPSWDAQNTWSVSLAEKLGYHLDYAYDAYEIYGY